jgi:hypothetical protein
LDDPSFAPMDAFALAARGTAPAAHAGGRRLALAASSFARSPPPLAS